MDYAFLLLVLYGERQRRCTNLTDTVCAKKLLRNQSVKLNRMLCYMPAVVINE
jgi:hypothetical protein